jgi:hypothetical protein
MAGLSPASIRFADELLVDFGINRVKFGWSGRIRTYDVLINSEADCQLAYTPAENWWVR